MRLCFGTYAKVIMCCANERLTRLDLLNTIVRSVDNTCELTSNAVTGLLQCTANLPKSRGNGLGDVLSKAAKADPQEVSSYFAKNVIPLIAPDKRRFAVLALREIFLLDKDIYKDTVVEMVSGTTKNTLVKQSSFVLADFLAGIFLYTAAGDNRIGKEAAKFVTTEFIQSFSGLEESISLSEPGGVVPACSFDEAVHTYLSNTEEAYNEVKTLLYLNQPKPFYSLYVPNYVRHTLGRYNHNTIKNVTAKSISDISNFIILDGMGGTGKTMMMRHLLLNAIAGYKDFRLVPIFISLKDYDGTDLTGFIYREAAAFNENLTKTMLRNGLNQGRFLLLLDGLDEIGDGCSRQFEKQLKQFTDKYSKNRFVMSSRSYQSFVSFARFTVLKIEPFTKNQALDFIDKIEFRPDEPGFKNRFRNLLADSLYNTHRSFIENPLLLTILLLTFEKFAGVPTQMHLFYKKAYITLAETHDASKSSYKRTFRSGMIPEKIADYFAEFCFHSYKDSKYEFTDEEFERYFNNMRINDKTTTAANFAYDLCANLCLMFYEGRYQFTHRSFQEYFCAVFFSNQDGAILERLGGFIEQEHKKQRMRGDQTFNMLYDMIPDRVEAKIFIPFLQKLFDKCNKEDGYWTYLKTMYPLIRYAKGEIHDYPVNSPTSYLIGFILDLIQPKYDLTLDDLPGHNDLTDMEYGYVQTNEDIRELVNLENIHEEYPWIDEMPEPVGRSYSLEVEKVYRNNRFYEEIRLVLDNDDFIFKSEYNAVRKYFEEIKVKKKDNYDYFADLL